MTIPLHVRGNALHLPFPEKTFQAVVTSPPYWGLRSYGDSELEPGRGSWFDYTVDMMNLFAQVRYVLRDDGVFWLNIGDTALGSGGAGGDYRKGGSKSDKPLYRQGAGPAGMNPGQWVGVPWRLASLAQANGFLLRSHVTWDKGVLRPEDLHHARRPGVTSESIFMFTKQSDYRFYPDEMTEPGDVWHFGPSKGKSHLAPFPDELPRRCIEASTVEGDFVLDPFGGSGTTARVAASMGRHGVGVELYPAVVAQAASHEDDMFARYDPI